MNVKRLNRILSMLIEEMRVLEDEGRDLPARWNIMHMYTSSQLAKLVAIKRNLDVELTGLIGALHDIAVVKTKKKTQHALLGPKYIDEIIELYNKDKRGNLDIITDEERRLINEVVIHHSDKDEISNNPYVELLKDVDSIDRYLHGVGTKGSYQDRSFKVMDELNIKNT